MECFTKTIELGEVVQRPKKKFDTLDKAIEVAKYENSKSEHFSKVWLTNVVFVINIISVETARH
jgi:hypothetical protein